MEGVDGEAALEPLVSVLIATYNGQRTIEVALENICNSTYRNLEIVILDDCSTDETYQICQKKAEKDSRISLNRNHTNLGINETYNQLFGLSRGKYIVWNDQDDKRDKTFIEKAVKYLELENDAVLCHSHTLVTVNHQPVHSTRLDSVVSKKTLLSRYWGLLRTFSDITIYGLIRRSAILETELWQMVPGSANVLLSDLLLLGPFGQISEVLFTYAGKGLANRPTVEQEAARSMPNKNHAYSRPWLTVTRTQSKGILTSKRINCKERTILLVMLWSHVLLTNLLKLVYRFSKRMNPRATKVILFSMFSRAVYSKRDIDYIIDPSTRPDIYPPEWPLVNV